ncbi:hypothetical protein HMPREF2534_01418 [Bacteroides thetaiotaomicron]|nr:hypothetical protein HMPREF2534_01418 [Bacteroides thetaiotaomicron]
MLLENSVCFIRYLFIYKYNIKILIYSILIIYMIILAIYMVSKIHSFI